MSDKRIYIKHPYAGKNRKAWNKQTKPFPSNRKRMVAKSEKNLYYNQGKQIKENEYGKVWYHNEYYNDDTDLVTTDKSSCSGELKAESQNDSVTNDSVSQPRFSFQHLHLPWHCKPENISAFL